MDKWLSRLAHNQEIEGSTPSPATIPSMSTNTTAPTYEVLPLNPENNPPESIEEIEILINKMQNKSASIKQQLEIVAIREKQGLPVNYTRVKRALFARSQTNKSVAELQRIVKHRRQQEALNSGQSFEKFFFEAAKENLPPDEFNIVLDNAFFRMRQFEKLSGD